MPDILGILSNFKNEIFLWRRMVIIFVWLVALLFLPRSLSNYFTDNIKIPYAYEIFVFSLSVLIYAFFNYIFKKNKLNKRARKIKLNKSVIEIKKAEEELETLKILDSLPKKEYKFINNLRSSGNVPQKYNADEVPTFINKLVDLNIIYLNSGPDVYDNYYFALTDKTIYILNKHLKKYQTDKILNT